MASGPRADPRPFGELLRRLRVAAGLTQEALAERAGLSARGLSDLERGVHGVPRRDTLDLLITALALGSADKAQLVVAATRRKTASARVRASSHTAGSVKDLSLAAAMLPIPTDRLIGREREVAAATKLFRDPSVHLVTLTGPGGVGKRRLALQLAVELQTDFPDGVAFVSLAAIRDAALVLPTIAQALGVREVPSRPPEEALAVALKGRRVLLVLDNLEQVLDAAPALGHLLAAVPVLRLLVTSRVALRLRGEQRYPVPPLATTQPGADDIADDLMSSPALRLFVQRARQVRPNVDLTPEATRAAAAICSRVDGLPLAIELAAARLRCSHGQHFWPDWSMRCRCLVEARGTSQSGYRPCGRPSPGAMTSLRQRRKGSSGRWRSLRADSPLRLQRQSAEMITVPQLRSLKRSRRWLRRACYGRRTTCLPSPASPCSRRFASTA